ncbi:hypothetical protein MADA3029_270053 [Vibrio nigripulchritudo MADA3029]|nr:hypothetical protein VIBNIMADA3020_420053 [Vibrio nigripulchritudo MADA3020]CCN56561.1 hypothetical protein VIBNIMADA3021_970056 [Vibrio nigripulchritudo MADA3021]CCN58816.1 hypothetical protein MADA3029_270053 [Vibrio nigripulchritudo MADA3029]
MSLKALSTVKTFPLGKSTWDISLFDIFLGSPSPFKIRTSFLVISSRITLSDLLRAMILSKYKNLKNALQRYLINKYLLFKKTPPNPIKKILILAPLSKEAIFEIIIGFMEYAKIVSIEFIFL